MVITKTRFREWIGDPHKSGRAVIGVLMILDVIVTLLAARFIPSALYGSFAKGYVLLAVFVLFPLTVVFVIGTIIAVVQSVRDWRSQRPA